MRMADDFNPLRATKRLLREAGEGALATLSPGGAPYASLVTVATAMDGAPICCCRGSRAIPPMLAPIRVFRSCWKESASAIRSKARG